MDVQNMSSCKILAIDDEKDILDLLEVTLKKEGFTNIFKAATGSQGIALCKNEKPDVVILDIMLPDIDGFEVCRRLREFTYTPILFLSAREEETDKLLGLGIGGDDYVTKPFSPREVAFRVKAQLRRNQYLVKEDIKRAVLRFGNLTIDEVRGEVRRGEDIVELTAKEYQLIVHLAKHPNQILSKNKLYEAVWGEDYLGDDNTLMVHIRRLREKLEEDPGSPRHLVTIKGLGYKLVNR